MSSGTAAEDCRCEVFLVERGVGEVRLRAQLRVRWSFRAQCPRKLLGRPFFWVEGGRFDFGFGFGFGGRCEQYLHKSCCIIPENCLL